MQAIITFCLCVVFLFPFELQASSKRSSVAIQLNVAAGDLPAQIDMIRKEAAGEDYIEMPRNNRLSLYGYLNALAKGSIDSSEIAKAESDVNTILANAFDDSRLICRNESIMGTNRKQRICVTKAQKTGQYKDTQLDFQRNLIPKSSPFEIQ
ncbi:MAG: hypothetical protein RL074_1312 [Bacteroidota bacterium]